MHEFQIPLGAKVRRVTLLTPDQPVPPARKLAPANSRAEQPPTPSSVIDNHVLEQLRSDRQLIGQVLARLEHQSAKLLPLQQQRIAEFQKASVEIALAVASRLLRQEVESGRFAIERLVNEIVSQFTSPALTVYLNPLDLQLLHERMNGQPVAAERDGTIVLAEDVKLRRGDCRIEDGEQVLLSHLESQIDSIREDLMRSLQNAAA